jgi:hypothetical protein
MNNSQSSNGGGGIVILLLILGYAAVKTVEAVVAAITALLMGLVNIALIVAGIIAAYWLYRYISDKQFGDDKKERKVNRIEKKRKEVTARLPRHVRGQANEYYIDQEKEVYDIKPQVSRADLILERTKQVVGILRRKEASK